jgi:hypothetical protein
MGLEDWEDMAHSIQIGVVREEMTLYVFWTALRLGDRETFEAGNGTLGWRVQKIPDQVWSREYSVLNWDGFTKRLERAGFACFISAINMIFYDTGNVYLDYNPYDEDPQPQFLPSFTVEGVRALEAEWAAAQPIIHDYQEAFTLFTETPGIPEMLLKIYTRSLEHEKPRVRVRTLVDLFTEELLEQNPESRVARAAQLAAQEIAEEEAIEDGYPIDWE